MSCHRHKRNGHQRNYEENGNHLLLIILVMDKTLTPWSMSYPNGLPKWTTLKNNIPNEYHFLVSSCYTLPIFVLEPLNTKY